MPATRPLLVVEDEEDDIFFLKRALQKTGVTNSIQTANTGQEAIDYLSGTGPYADRVRFPLPFLVLLDLKLPGITGLELLKWIRTESSHPTLLVVVLSSSTLAADIAEAYSSGANSYIVKATDPDQFLECIRDFANWWLRRNIPPPEMGY